jgi:hypothetical protein
MPWTYPPPRCRCPEDGVPCARCVAEGAHRSPYRPRTILPPQPAGPRPTLRPGTRYAMHAARGRCRRCGAREPRSGKTRCEACATHDMQQSQQYKLRHEKEEPCP